VLIENEEFDNLWICHFECYLFFKKREEEEIFNEI